MSFPISALVRQREHGRRQRQLILDFLRDYQVANDWMPTIREVAEALGVSLSTAHEHLRILASEGRIEKGPGPRMIRVIAGGSIRVKR